MRKALLLIALAAMAGIWIVTYQAIYGPQPLPPRIPTHFDVAGNVNGWGEPKMLWLFPIISTFIVGLLTLVSRLPQAFNYPIRVTPATRPQFEAISIDMIVWLRAELVCVFLWIQVAIISSARQGRGSFSPWLVPLLILAIFATIGWHLAAIIRVGRGVRNV